MNPTAPALPPLDAEVRELLYHAGRTAGRLWLDVADVVDAVVEVRPDLLPSAFEPRPRRSIPAGTTSVGFAPRLRELLRRAGERLHAEQGDVGRPVGLADLMAAAFEAAPSRNRVPARTVQTDEATAIMAVVTSWLDAISGRSTAVDWAALQAQASAVEARHAVPGPD